MLENIEKNTRLSVIVPVYNEQEVLLEFHGRTKGVLAHTGYPFEIIYVNDGSSDSTLSILRSLSNNDKHVAIIDLSRNFGKEIAMSAGLDFACGDAVVIIDADLQDPPELIPALINEWKNGYDVVYARRKVREGETWLKKLTAHLFYRIIQRMTNVQIPEDTGDFRLMSRRAVDSMKELRERHRFMKGLYAWIGYPQTAVEYQRDPRFAGQTKFNYWKLWNFALEGITSFTIAPLKVATYLGFLTAVGAFLYGLFIVLKTIMIGGDLPGYPSIMVVILFLGGIQLISIGLIGEYLGRTYVEVKQRPLYLINKYDPADIQRDVAETGEME